MNLIYFDEIGSTQKYLIEKIKNGEVGSPVCIWTEMQTDGIGSRNNIWIGKKGNLFFSFTCEKDKFENIPLQSLSIYFGWIFKTTLNEMGSKAVMKWPNDIYLVEEETLKIGGVITNIIKNYIVCGIGLNTRFSPTDKFGRLDINVKNDKILKRFFYNLTKNIEWEFVIEEFRREFERYKRLFNIDGDLQKDGSLEINQKRVYSRR
jgi:BirA family biotin operon repressor/biotin-[acetyl-CoA-carboxylase] ligase